MPFFKAKNIPVEKAAAKLIEQITGQQLEALLNHEDQVTLSLTCNNKSVFKTEFEAEDWFGHVQLRSINHKTSAP